MAFLEDVLVPVYLYHRYQAEAVTKIIGGMYYTYALRDDGQIITKIVSKEDQRKALNAIITILDPSFLKLPETITQLIPPRPANYDYTRELFKKRTGLAFDALSPAETAVDLPLSLLFNSERLNRMAQYEISGDGLGLQEMITTLINATWKSPRRNGMEGLIQLQTEQMILTYLLAASVNENNSFVVQAILQKALNDLKTYIDTKKKTTTDTRYSGHLLLALERMKNPKDAKPTTHAAMPPGAPIGCGE